MKTVKIYPTGIMTFYNNNHIDFRNVNEKGKVGPAKNLYKKTARNLFKSVSKDIEEYSFKGIIPKHIKYADCSSHLILVWTKKSHVSNLYFTTKKNKLEGAYAIPNLCFHLKNRTLKVVAYKRFSENSLAYKAPFVNMGSSSICMGSASLNLDRFEYYEDIVEYAEHKFFNSQFSHVKDVSKYHLMGKGKKQYNNDWLKPIGKLTIKKFINENV